MSNTIVELITVLSEKGALLGDMQRLLEEEQQCIIALDLARMETNQGAIDAVMARMERLNDSCRQLLSRVGGDFGLKGNSTLSPIIARVKIPERDTLQGLQARLHSSSASLDRVLAVNRGLLEDSLGIVGHSLSFFNGMFTSATTYGEAGRMVSSSSGARLVCKEI